MKLSEEIEQFLNLCDSCKTTYEYNFNTVEKCNKITQDFLRALELDGLTYLAAAERSNRLERRKAKNIVEVYEPFLNKFMSMSETTRALNVLKQVLGEVRKIERYHENRVYKKRVE